MKSTTKVKLVLTVAFAVLVGTVANAFLVWAPNVRSPVHPQVFIFICSVAASTSIVLLLDVLLTLSGSSLNKVATNIFWPIIREELEEKRYARAYSKYRTFTLNKNSKYLKYVGGEYTDIIYLNPSTYCQVTIKDGKMEVQTGPQVEAITYNASGLKSKNYDPILVFIGE